MSDLRSTRTPTPKNISYSKPVTSSLFRFRIDAFKTKYKMDIRCVCGKQITPVHVLFVCEPLRAYKPVSLADGHLLLMIHYAMFHVLLTLL